MRLSLPRLKMPRLPIWYPGMAVYGAERLGDGFTG